ncbi:hypothetical protein DASC09_015470 [Saccharomycopsis crataegensis]|uniref:RRM domain-containing protein n=1 Tax=Saccharomycopsis crataegensis TaxID=43959 RepID=A0AAV5QHY6_9ASCO|nr:hypothetical protein DASC09_015470 [Saccharomycopsis crataegensis]
MEVDQEECSSSVLNPARSIEGYVIIALNVHPEASEDDIIDFFDEFGKVKNVQLNMDRQTGYAKGYALVEYEKLREAETAVDEADNSELLGKRLVVDFAFLEGNEDNIQSSNRERSRSPGGSKRW